MTGHRVYQVSMGVIFSVLFFSACHTMKEMSEHPEMKNSTLSYLALGDSYTIGESVDEPDRFPVQLTEKLRGEGLDIEDPVIVATTGWTTKDLSNAMDESGIDATVFDIVTLLIGVNDQYQHRDINLYPGNFENLLDRAIKIAGDDPARVFVVSIPDYAYTSFGQTMDPDRISGEIDAYNKINRDISREKKVRYFDITPISRRGLKEKALVAGDGLHPSGEMYSLWTDLMIGPVAVQIRSMK